MQVTQQRAGSCEHTLNTKFSMVLLCFLFLFAEGVRAEDAKTRVEQLFAQYFVYFNSGESELIAKNIISPPVQLSDFDSHEVWLTQSEISSGFALAIKDLQSKGWSKSVINELDVCVVADNLAFVELNYSRQNTSGEPMPPAERRGLYVVLKSDLGWRIIADYHHDIDKQLECSI
jgi:hypothetical protein